MRVEEIPLALTYNDVLLVPQRSRIKSRDDVILKTKITPKLEINFPVVSINMNTVTGIEMAVAMHQFGGISFYPRFDTPETQAKEVKEILKRGANVIPAVGIKETEFERFALLVKTGVQAITIDVAHGHLEQSLHFLKVVKKKYPDIEVVAGVVGTYEGTRDLFEAGADSVRVGVGPGTVCTTRNVAGVGVPQITATLEAFRAAQEYNRPIITDGGTKTAGDIVKGLAAGANVVSVGSQLAGTDEAPGKIITYKGIKCKAYNGSTSKEEKLQHLKMNGSDKSASYADYVEGVASYVPYKGSVENVLAKMEKGIRSGMTYCNAQTIDELHENARFIRITHASIEENGAHGVLT